MSDRQRSADQGKGPTVRPERDEKDTGGKRPDLSLTQLVASGLATVIAAVGASRLGVAGTVIGAAFMSVVSTACSVLMRHYMDRGRQQVLELAGGDHPLILTRPPRADPVETMMDITRVRPDPLHADPAVTRWDLDVTRLDAYALQQAPEPAKSDRPAWGPAKDHRPAWLPGWKILATGAAAVFVVVLGGLVAVEAVTGVPPSKLPGGGGGNGASFIPVNSGHTTPGNNDQNPTRTPGEQVTPSAPRSQRPGTGGVTPNPDPTPTAPEQSPTPTPSLGSPGGSQRPNPPSQSPPPAQHGGSGRTGTS
jgi:hypothetical protein